VWSGLLWFCQCLRAHRSRNCHIHKIAYCFRNCF
jgi:hypothetical protein